MRTRKDRRLVRLLWPAALDGVCGAIILCLVLIGLGLLHPALALPPIGLGIVGALSRPDGVRDPDRSGPANTSSPSGDGEHST